MLGKNRQSKNIDRDVHGEPQKFEMFGHVSFANVQINASRG